MNNLPSKLIDKLHSTIILHLDELTTLDQAIGDGDHGINMRRGLDKILESKTELVKLPLNEALHKTGMILVMNIGGASGPLYGSLLMAMGKKTLKTGVNNTNELADLLEAGVEAVKSRGKSSTGCKTMLDVLVPVQKALKGGTLAKIKQTAKESLQQTKDMIATKGRASYLKERSKGHLDPGAYSSFLMIETICDFMEEEHER